jgi:hypothetical protein
VRTEHNTVLGAPEPQSTWTFQTGSNTCLSTTDGVYATTTLPNSNTESEAIIATGFGFAIPSSATLVRIQMILVRKGNLVIPNQFFEGSLYGIVINNVWNQLQGPFLIMENWSQTNWETITVELNSAIINFDLIPAIVNNLGFGVSIRVSSASGGKTVYYDSIGLIISYTIPGSSNVLSSPIHYTTTISHSAPPITVPAVIETNRVSGALSTLSCDIKSITARLQWVDTPSTPVNIFNMVLRVVISNPDGTTTTKTYLPTSDKGTSFKIVDNQTAIGIYPDQKLLDAWHSSTTDNILDNGLTQAQASSVTDGLVVSVSEKTDWYWAGPGYSPNDNINGNLTVIFPAPDQGIIQSISIIPLMNVITISH